MRARPKKNIHTVSSRAANKIVSADQADGWKPCKNPACKYKSRHGGYCCPQCRRDQWLSGKGMYIHITRAREWAQSIPFSEFKDKPTLIALMDEEAKGPLELRRHRPYTKEWWGCLLVVIVCLLIFLLVILVNKKWPGFFRSI